MESITAVISAALLSGLNDVGKAATKDAYSGLKNQLKKLLGQESEPIKSLEKLEKKPDSEARQAVLNEDLVALKVVEKIEIQALVEALSKQLAATDSGQAALSQFNIKAEKIGVVAHTVDNVNQTFN